MKANEFREALDEIRDLAEVVETLLEDLHSVASPKQRKVLGKSCAAAADLLFAVRDADAKSES